MFDKNMTDSQKNRKLFKNNVQVLLLCYKLFIIWQMFLQLEAKVVAPNFAFEYIFKRLQLVLYPNIEILNM